MALELVAIIAVILRPRKISPLRLSTSCLQCVQPPHPSSHHLDKIYAIPVKDYSTQAIDIQFKGRKSRDRQMGAYASHLDWSGAMKSVP